MLTRYKFIVTSHETHDSAADAAATYEGAIHVPVDQIQDLADLPGTKGPSPLWKHIVDHMLMGLHDNRDDMVHTLSQHMGARLETKFEAMPDLADELREHINHQPAHNVKSMQQILKDLVITGLKVEREQREKQERVRQEKREELRKRRKAEEVEQAKEAPVKEDGEGEKEEDATDAQGE